MVSPLTPRIDKLDLTNVRSSDGSGGSVTLTSSDNRIQIFNLSVAKTCVLPSTGIVKGEKWVIKKADATAKLTIACPSAASSSSAYIPSSVNICFLDSKFAYAEFIALQDNPTTPDHWDMNFRFIEKLYSHGSAYNGGNTITVAGPDALEIRRANFTPYQLFDGTWRLQGIVCIRTGGVAGTSFTVTGITSKNVASFFQGGSIANNNTFAGMVKVTPNTNSFQSSVSTGVEYHSYSFDIELDIKPTWAF